MNNESILFALEHVFALDVWRINMNSKNFISILEALGETLEKDKMTILCQQYEIEELRKTVEELSRKIDRKEVCDE